MTPIGSSNLEPNGEYGLYNEANMRHTQAVAAGATSSPSGWYELLRFGRNIGTDPLPANAAHWRKIPTDVGTVWADLNAPGTRKFSDADFPAFKGWNCFDDDPSPDNQRCDSVELKRLIRDHEAPPHSRAGRSGSAPRGCKVRVSYLSKNNILKYAAQKFLAIGFAVQLVGNLRAETTSQVLCFTKIESAARHWSITLKIKYCFDEELQHQIGAFAKYSTSPIAISLPPAEEYTADETVDYELH